MQQGCPREGNIRHNAQEKITENCMAFMMGRTSIVDETLCHAAHVKAC